MTEGIDVREIAVSAMFPNGIPPERFREAINLIGSLTVAILSGHAPPASNPKTQAPQPGRSIIPGSARDRILKLMADGRPRTMTQIQKAIGVSSATISVAMRKTKGLVRNTGVTGFPARAFVYQVKGSTP